MNSLACQIRLLFGTILTMTWSRDWMEVPKAVQPTVDRLGGLVKEVEHDAANVVMAFGLRTNLDELKRLLVEEGCSDHGDRMANIRRLCANVLQAFHGVS